MGCVRATPSSARGADMMQTRYKWNFYVWANQQAALLRAGRFTTADLELSNRDITNVS